MRLCDAQASHRCDMPQPCPGEELVCVAATEPPPIPDECLEGGVRPRVEPPVVNLEQRDRGVERGLDSTIDDRALPLEFAAYRGQLVPTRIRKRSERPCHRRSTSHEPVVALPRLLRGGAGEVGGRSRPE